MAFTEEQRISIRKYLGAAEIYLDAEPLLENAMNAVQSPPKATTAQELAVIAQLAKLEAVDVALDELGCLSTIRVDGVEVDAVRARMVKIAWGRTLASRLAVMLGLNGVIRDCFSAQPAGNIDMPYQMSGRRAYG
jgi:hypothetical protein